MSGWRPQYEGEFPTLGWVVLDWSRSFLPSPQDPTKPFRFTQEQARRILHLYRLDPLTGKRRCIRCQLEEAKGWGKSPWAAAIALAEFCGPVLFDGWDANGRPVGMPWGSLGTPHPWIQIAGVSEAATENTWNALYAFLSVNEHAAAHELRIDLGRTLLRRYDLGAALMERVTSSAQSREGQPITFAVCDEPQLWKPDNGGTELARTIIRNLDKMSGCCLFTGNAPVMGEGSVAERYSDPEDGVLHFATRPTEEPKPDWTDEQLRAQLERVYAGVPWIDVDRQLASVRSATTPWSESLRFKFNWRVKGDATDAWMPADLWAAHADPGLQMVATEPTFVAVRVAHDHRSAAIAAAQRRGDEVFVTTHCFTQPIAGAFLSAALLEEHIRGLRLRFPARVMAPRRFSQRGKEYLRPAPGPEVAYHGAFFEGSAQRLAAVGVVTVDVPSSSERLTPAAETVMRLVTDGQLVHDGDGEVAAQVSHVLAKPAAKGWAIAAADDEAGHPWPIVAAQAVMLAVHRVMTAPPVPKYRTRGIHR